MRGIKILGTLSIISFVFFISHEASAQVTSKNNIVYSQAGTTRADQKESSFARILRPKVCPMISRVCKDGSEARRGVNCSQICAEDSKIKRPPIAEVPPPIQACPRIARICLDGSNAQRGVGCSLVCPEDNARIQNYSAPSSRFSVGVE